MAIEVAELWCWEDVANGRPWTAGEWEKDWPPETFTQGEGNPVGLLSSLATFHNQQGNLHTLELRLVSEPQGVITVARRFAEVQYERPEWREFTVRGECGLFLHRWRETDPLIVKIEAPDGDGAGLYRIYTWWQAVKRTWRRVDNGPWEKV